MVRSSLEWLAVGYCPEQWGSHACKLPAGHKGRGRRCYCCCPTPRLHRFRLLHRRNGCVGAFPYYRPYLKSAARG